MRRLSHFKSTKPREEGGFILPVLLITGVMIVLMIIAVGGEAVTNQNLAAHSNYAIEAQMAADAGLDDAMNKMNTTTGWTGTGGEVTLLNDTTRN
jgi:Tfp pilus assembly protein PilX